MTQKTAEKIRTNGTKAWFLAARPKTLSGAVAPVAVALSAAWTDGGRLAWQPAVLCAMFALLMQIDANFVNDYLDFMNGTDGRDRLGPERACAQGWITPGAMRRGIAVATVASCLAGLPLVWWGGWAMLPVGATCVVACFLYTTSLSRIAMGDLLVLLFFGIVPVCTTYYLQTRTATLPVVLAAVAMGLATDCLLLVNNYRDRETDRRAGKRTLVVLIGSRATEWLYLLFGLAAVLLVASQTVLPVLYLPLHLSNALRMRRLRAGRALNAVLGRTALAILLFAVLYSLGRILHI